MTYAFMTRRHALAGGVSALATLGLFEAALSAEALPPVKAYRNPGCGCCERWAGLMQTAGFDITMEDDSDLAGRKAGLGVPEQISGCHTALIGGYVIEGHVPPADIVRFLAGKPDALGLSVPGMPVGSPGMEMADKKEPYDVLIFAKNGSWKVYASHS